MAAAPARRSIVGQGHGAAMQACHSVTLCALLAGALGLATWLRLPDLLEVAVVAVVLVALKIVGFDIFTLPAGLAIPTVLSLAIVLFVASVAMRRRAR